MKKVKIYIPAKNAMQSGLAKNNKWLLEYYTDNKNLNPLMGWETSSDTLSEVKLEFSSRDAAINYAKKNNIDYDLIEPKKRKVVKKSYAENFIK
jgi:NADH dehydrogenase (ubiquinone) Fe-S protein 4